MLGQLLERAQAQLLERALEQPSERALEQLSERALEQLSERALEQPVERVLEQPLEGQLEPQQLLAPQLPGWQPLPPLQVLSRGVTQTLWQPDVFILAWTRKPCFQDRVYSRFMQSDRVTAMMCPVREEMLERQLHNGPDVLSVC